MNWFHFVCKVCHRNISKYWFYIRICVSDSVSYDVLNPGTCRRTDFLIRNGLYTAISYDFFSQVAETDWFCHTKQVVPGFFVWFFFQVLLLWFHVHIQYLHCVYFYVMAHLTMRTFCSILIDEENRISGRRLAITLQIGGDIMPITLTFHVFHYTITVTVKSKNRHSAKWRFFF